MKRKRCNRCRVTKELSEYHRRGKKHVGICKECLSVKKACVVCSPKNADRICAPCKRNLAEEGLAYCIYHQETHDIAEFRIRKDNGLPMGSCKIAGEERRQSRLQDADDIYGVIAPAMRKAPRGNNVHTSCGRCEAERRCDVFVKLDLPVECEKISKSDVYQILSLGERELARIGFLDRIIQWDDIILNKWQDAVRELS